MEVTLSKFAEMAGVKPSSIFEKIKNGTLVRNSNKKLDTENVINKEYLEKKQGKLKSDFIKKELENAAIYEAQESSEADFESNSEEHGSYVTVKMINAIRKINRDLKTAKDVDDWIAREKNLTLIYEKQQKIDERNGTLIERKFVESDVYTYLETVKNSIEDSPESNIDNFLATIDAAKPEERRAAGLAYWKRINSKLLENAVEHTVSIINGYEQKENENEKIIQAVKELQEAQNEE